MFEFWIWQYPNLLGISITWWLIFFFLIPAIVAVVFIILGLGCFAQEGEGAMCKAAMGWGIIGLLIIIPLLILGWITSIYVLTIAIGYGVSNVAFPDLFLSALIMIFTLPIIKAVS